MEEQVVFYFALIAGVMVFASIMGLSGNITDIALAGEARLLIKNLQDAVQQVKSSPMDAYVELEFMLPERLGSKEYEVRFIPGSVTVTVDAKSFDDGIEVDNAETASGGGSLSIYKRENSAQVFVRRK
jgi:uncharacterized protein YdeI (BOF family)